MDSACPGCAPSAPDAPAQRPSCGLCRAPQPVPSRLDFYTMNEDNEAAPPAEPAKPSEPLIRQIQPPIQGIKAQVRQIGPIIQAIQGSEALRRQVEPIVQAVQQFARADGWPVQPFPQRVARAMDAAIRELLAPPPPPDVRSGSFVGYASGVGTVTGIASVTGVGTVTASGSVAMPPMRTAGQMTVKNRSSWIVGLSDGQLVFLVLVWLIAFVVPLLPDLPPKLHATLSDSYATLALALAITWRIRDKHK